MDTESMNLIDIDNFGDLESLGETNPKIQHILLCIKLRKKNEPDLTEQTIWSDMRIKWLQKSLLIAAQEERDRHAIQLGHVVDI